MTDERHTAEAPRWNGRPGRMEVWYATLSDPVTHAAVWVHYETVSPVNGSGPYAHGWVTWFPSDGPPCTRRFGPEPVAPVLIGGPWCSVGGASIGPEVIVGQSGSFAWDLHWQDASAPLWTFPRYAWEREVLPGAQVVIAPSAHFSGSITVGETTHSIDGWRGAVSHIYGHGNARRWGWIHADLGNDDVLEVVTAVSGRPGLRRLKPLAFLRLRVDGRDWPTGPLPALRVRTILSLHHWQLEGRISGRDVLIRVDQPPARCVNLSYTDPDGTTCVCTNTEQADIHVEIGDRTWAVLGTGHAEVGLRGTDAPAVDERAVS